MPCGIYRHILASNFPEPLNSEPIRVSGLGLGMVAGPLAVNVGVNDSLAVAGPFPEVPNEIYKHILASNFSDAVVTIPQVASLHPKPCCTEHDRKSCKPGACFAPREQSMRATCTAAPTVGNTVGK